ncbi:MAG: Hsp20/alpha crystallin family protein [Fibrobacter sp.]|jgi:HSP20 family protein|nr:Hsp20/alpha crystallin family protein [Fibrobacter sp.]
MHLPILHRHRNRTDEKTWQQAWARALDLMENPFSHSSLLSSYPPITVNENEKEVLVIAEVPGMCSRDINLSIQDGVLSISGEKKEEKMEGEVYREVNYGYFSREIPLGKNLKWDMAKAQCQNGQLTVRIPKKEEQITKVKVKIE